MKAPAFALSLLCATTGGVAFAQQSVPLDPYPVIPAAPPVDALPLYPAMPVGPEPSHYRVMLPTVQLTGREAEPDKQKRCDQEIARSGMTTAPGISARFILTDEQNRLQIVRGGRVLSDEAVPHWVTEHLCRYAVARMMSLGSVQRAYYQAPAPIYSYPPAPQYPVYTARPLQIQPAPVVCTKGSCAPATDRLRWFSMGLRLSAMAIGQQINGQDVWLVGGGLQSRIRGRGRFGVEFSMDYLKGDFGAPNVPRVQAGGPSSVGTTSTGPFFHIDNVTRESYPIQLTALFYFWPNKDSQVFNLYALGGAGVIPTTMGLTDENGRRVHQDFTEWEGHLGGGAELRFHWFAMEADLRGFAMFRDDSDKPSSYYSNVSGAPVPKQSFGFQANLAATIWF